MDLRLERRTKTLSNIAHFIPLTVRINEPPRELTITVPRTHTIEQLAHQIEAEYAYVVEREEGQSRYPMIECGALFDVDQIQLRFSDLVEDVLDRGSIVHVINIDHGK